MAVNTINPTGVYKNARLMHACTSIVGYTVHLQTKEGIVWEGIFETFNHDFTVCLHFAIPIDPKLNHKDCLYHALKSGSQAKEQAFFDLKDIVRISAVDVDLNYAAKANESSGSNKALATDADISGFDINKSSEMGRQLESWQDDDGDINADSLLSLDEVANASGNGGKNDSRNSSRGWDAQDMFRYNERVHNVTTTYDEKLTDYTLPLPKHSTKEWRKKQEKAAAIAKEIEGNTKSQGRLAKEDEGDCEEEKFSAVIRPIPSAAIVTSSSSPATSSPAVVTTAPVSAITTTTTSTTPSNPTPNNANSTSTLPTVQSTTKPVPGPHPPAPHPKMFRTRNYRSTRVENSLKNFSRQLNIAPNPASNPNPNSGPTSGPHHHHHHHHNHNHHQPPPQQSHVPGRNINERNDYGTSSLPPASSSLSSTTTTSSTVTTSTPPTTTTATSPATTSISPATTSISTATTTTTPTTTPTTTSTITTVSQSKDHQSEIARKSKLNPNAKEFVYKPANQATTPSGPVTDPVPPPPHAGAYYQQVPIFDAHQQQQHHAAQYMANNTHPHFQNQIHYMSPMPANFSQQMPRGYIRGNFQGYHNGPRPEYNQAPMIAPQPSGAPHPMNAYPGSPQQPMIYGGPHNMYPVVQAGFPQHMTHVISNLPPYDGSTVYMPPQNYILNP